MKSTDDPSLIDLLEYRRKFDEYAEVFDGTDFGPEGIDLREASPYERRKARAGWAWRENRREATIHEGTDSFNKSLERAVDRGQDNGIIEAIDTAKLEEMMTLHPRTRR